jgi:hypothetical protein
VIHQFIALAAEGRQPVVAAIDEPKIQARIGENTAKIEIPVEWKSGAPEWGQLEVSIVSLEGKILARKSSTVFAIKKNHTYQMAVAPAPNRNLQLYCIEYTLTLSDGGKVEGKKSLAESVGMLETHLIGSDRLLVGSKPTLRLIALNHSTGEPIPDAGVTFAIRSPSREIPLFRGRTDQSGTVNASFDIPKNVTGQQTLVVHVNSSLGEDVIENPVRLEKTYKVLLTTDKPLYQPGQIIHIRSLSLLTANLQPARNESALIEVQDAKGNKVFKLNAKTDRFGIAAADFMLADEVNVGTYKIRTAVGETVTEKDVTVKRYVLPKFKVNLTTEKDYYMPGETLRGEVQSDYFFGKPVTTGIVVVELSRFDVEFSQFARVEGKTDSAGHYSFEAKLPEYFVGQPLQQGKAFIKIDLRIVDGADHKEEITRNVNVAADPLIVVAIPESGTLVPDVENIVYIVATYPDGRPAAANIDVSIAPTNTKITGLKTDALGITSFKLTPTANQLDLTVSARDKQGNHSEKTITLYAQPGEYHVLLRTDQALYKVGDSVRATVLATRPRGTVYVDLIKEGQTVLTRSLELQNGRGQLEVALSPDLSGSLQMNAYQITPASDIVRDSRLLYVNPANDLTIDVKPDKAVYRPGEEASIQFFVRDKTGHPVLAALGVSIVDESVFALQEMQPGLEKVYFTLEKELMKPRYEIHGYDVDDIILNDAPANRPEEISLRKEAARVLLASAETLREPSLRVNTYDSKQSAVRTEAEKIMSEKTKKVEEALKRYQKRHGRFPSQGESLAVLVEERLLKAADAKDPWGNFYRVENAGFMWNDYLTFQLVSIGPDEKANTTDDVRVSYSPEMKERRLLGRMADMAGRVEEAAMAPMAQMKAAFNAVGDKEKDELSNSGVASTGSGEGKPQVRIREYFPETLYFNPAIITGPNGDARISLSMADSITTWRMATMASSLGGALGSTSTPLRVFQDFFVDIDLPPALTQNDRISIPVAVYNYLPGSQKVRLEVTREDWFELLDEPVKEIDLEKDEVTVVYFTITAKKVGWRTLTVHGFGSKMNDAIKRQVLILPDGKETLVNYNDRLSGVIEKTIEIPQGAIDDASTILVKIYPGIFSQVVEGLDSILQMPFGCFEQTSSATYPNILVVDYVKTTKQITPEVQMKAEGFINTGYQRLLSFEVAGGGFEWFGNPPANQILTAYGLIEFKDMSKVHEVDPAVIDRTQRWLLSKQQNDGSWSPDQSYLHQESWGRIQNSNLPVTAYVAWALLESGYNGPEAQKAVSYIKNHLNEANDPYLLTLCANALVLADRQNEDAFLKLLELKKEENGAIHWESKLETMTFGNGKGADIETTAMATIAFLRSGRYSDVANKAMTYLIRAKDPSGTWYSTQATVLALKAMVIALGNATEDVNGNVSISHDDKAVTTIKITSADSDVMRLVDLKPHVHKGNNNVKIRFEGKGSMLYQIVGRHYLPWRADEKALQEPLTIDVNYDKTHIEKDDMVSCNVRISNNRPAAANMVIVDLGVPPGFAVQSDGLQKMVEQKTIEKYTLTGRQIIVYLSKIGPRAELRLSYQLRAKFPVKAKTPASRVYEYYDPSVENFAKPVMLEIKN